MSHYVPVRIIVPCPSLYLCPMSSLHLSHLSYVSKLSPLSLHYFLSSSLPEGALCTSSAPHPTFLFLPNFPNPREWWLSLPNILYIIKTFVHIVVKWATLVMLCGYIFFFCLFLFFLIFFFIIFFLHHLLLLHLLRRRSSS